MYFNSRDERCKTPFGAVICGAELEFTLFAEPDEFYSSCTLSVVDDFSGRETVFPLSSCPEGFTIHWQAPDIATLLWYHFSLYSAGGELTLLGRGGRGTSDPWQLTVYRSRNPFPAWFGRGVTYQIFPDRFFCNSSLLNDCSPFHRILHDKWSDSPKYLPDSDGEIRCDDYFGGTISGIIEKLPYLASLGVETLYLNPIFLADSNHRYNTADYMTVDPLLGTEGDFSRLCREAALLDIRVLLDGVFNHTGSNSVYFNREHSFPGVGAYQSPDSPFANWYRFHPWPDSYDAWWGVSTLPAVNEDDPDYRQFIIRGQDSVVRHWLRAGASGWRLDVADELPDDFIAQIRSVMTEEKPDSFLLGEVWEDGSNKIAYSRRRRYLLGDEVNGLMNYPFRTATIEWLRGGDAAVFRETMETIRENYPPCAFYSAMNLLGTHDTPRILTAIGADSVPQDRCRRAAFRLSSEARKRAITLLRLGAVLQFTFPGSPSIYYGDEAGMEGFEDPFCRGTYPWGQEDNALLSFYRRLGQLRKTRLSLREGSLIWHSAKGGLLAFSRVSADETTATVLNAGPIPVTAILPFPGDLATDALSGQQFLVRNGKAVLFLPPHSGLLLI